MTDDIASDIWLGDYLQDWKKTRIKRVCRFAPSFSNGKPGPEDECTVVAMEAVSEHGVVSVGVQEPYGDIIAGLNLFENGDVLFAKITPCMENGKGAFVEHLPTPYAFGSTEFHVMRPDHKIDGRFLYYVTFNPTFRAWAEKNMHGAAGQQRVSARFLKYTRLPLPPYEEQKRIAVYLDASCAAIDRAMEAKHKQLKTIDTLRKTIIQKAVTQGIDPNVEMIDSGVDYLGSVPLHWRVIKLKRLLSEPLSYGLNESGTDETTNNPRYIRITDFGKDGRLKDETFRSLPPEIAANALLKEGDILLARSGATVGKSFLFTNYAGEACYAGYLVKASAAKHLILPYFLYLYTRSITYESWKNLIFTQATIQNISATKYASLEIPVPDTSEQQYILCFLDDELKKLESIESVIENQITTLTNYRKSLIHECVTGKRRITEADLAKVGADV